MALVTCSITKEKIDKKLAFSIPISETRYKYYKSEAVYKDSLMKEVFYEDFRLFSGLRNCDKIPVEVYSYFSRINEDYTWTEIYKALEYKSYDIAELRDKEFNGTSGKLLYMCRVVSEGLVSSQGWTTVVKDVDVDSDTYNDILNGVVKVRKEKKSRRILSNAKKTNY